MGRFNDIMQKGLYRSRNGFILGVCRGIADYFDFSVFWVRILVVIVFFLTGIWPIGVLYFLAALLMKLEPVIPIQSEEEQEFYDSYTTSRHRAAPRLKRRYENLERRIRRMEDTVTSRDFDWEERLNTEH
jgi:phage shock protein C